MTKAKRIRVLTDAYRRIADLHDALKADLHAASVALSEDQGQPLGGLQHARAMAAQALAEVVSGRAPITHHF